MRGVGCGRTPRLDALVRAARARRARELFGSQASVMRRLLASTVVHVGIATGLDESQAPAGCAFHYGHSDTPCCGQEGNGVAPSDPHVCPATLPTCTGYVYNHHYGWCANTASGTAFCASCLATVLEGTDCAYACFTLSPCHAPH